MISPLVFFFISCKQREYKKLAAHIRLSVNFQCKKQSNVEQVSGRKGWKRKFYTCCLAGSESDDPNKRKRKCKVHT